MFTVDANVERWETALLSLRGAQRLPLLLCLNWHLRQRDTARADAMGSEALARLQAETRPAERRRAEARIALVRAESQWLNGELDDALAHAEAILRDFTDSADAPGCIDARWLLGWISAERGDHERSTAEFRAAADGARALGDRLREACTDAAIARWSVLHDRDAALARWGATITPALGQLHPSLAAWVSDFLALAASAAGNFEAAAGHFMRCYESALETGQVRAAITAATNLGADFSDLNDHHCALEWMQCALKLARPAGWPPSIGACLMHTADTLRRLGQLDAAHAMLQEALQILKPLANAHSDAVALQYLGDLSLDMGDHAGALAAFQALEARAAALDQSDFPSVARRGQAHALLQLERPLEALDAANCAVALATRKRHPYQRIAALRVLALIHARHRLPAPEGMAALNPALHYLQLALDVACSIDAHSISCDLLEAMAREYADAGDYIRAWEAARSASAARETAHRREAANRIIAMQVHDRTEHARSEDSHHRELAESEARSAEVLQRTSATLKRLSSIGQEITTHLDAAAVFRVLDRHIHGLLSVSTFAIYLTDPTGTMLNRAFGVELGKVLPTATIALSNPDAHAVRCLAERREIYLEHGPHAAHRSAVPGAIDTMSALFVPLIVGEHAIGVMTVQAAEPHAYGENERMIFRTLCAYGAIALDNAEAYRRLQDAQTLLASQEKLAALGALMAGVAHELNTPIGNSLLIASTLQEKTSQVERLMNGQGLRRSELAAYIDDARVASELVMRGLTSAADLVNSLKQVALDRTTEQRRNFKLQQVCREIIATMMNRVRAGNHKIEIVVDDTIALDSYPGPFGQVITNFINNALLHAFDPGQGGHMTLTASTPVAGRVQIEFRDNGKGIAAEHLGRIFDPFFTTKLGQGGSGLGLSICHNIVTSLLGGQISTCSGADQGACFRLDLPLTAPEADRDSAGCARPN